MTASSACNRLAADKAGRPGCRASVEPDTNHSSSVRRIRPTAALTGRTSLVVIGVSVCPRLPSAQEVRAAGTLSGSACWGGVTWTAVLLHLPADGTHSAASTWLRWDPSHPPLLSDLDRAELLSGLRTSTPREAASHVALALLDGPHILGDPTALLIELAAADGRTAAVSRLLKLFAHRAPRTTTALVTTSAVELWRAALTADLLAGALAGAGTFALTSIDDTLWLDLTLASARHTPALRDMDHIAERSAHHPDKPAVAQRSAS